MSISSISSSINNNYEIQKASLEKSAQNQQTSNNSEATVSATKTTETKPASEASSVIAVSAHGDTVEISGKGMLKAQIRSESANNESKGQPSANETTSANSSTVQSLSSTDSNDSDDSDDTTDLSQYTINELKEMLTKGTIARSEYDAEIESRQSSKATSESDSSVQQSTSAAE